MVIAGEEQHRFGDQMTAGGAGGRPELVVRVEDQGGRTGDAGGASPGGALIRAQIPRGDILPDRFAGHGAAGGGQGADPVQFAEDGVDAAGAVDILDMVIG